MWRLRSEDHQCKRLQLQQEQQEREDMENQKRSEEKERDRLVNLFFAKRRQSLTAEILGGGEYGQKWADWLIRVQYALSMSDWWRTDNRGLDAEPKIKPNQA